MLGPRCGSIVWYRGSAKKRERHHPFLLQGGSHPSSSNTTPTFQQPFVWYDILDISFPRAKHRQHYGVGKLWKQSPLSDFSQ